MSSRQTLTSTDRLPLAIGSIVFAVFALAFGDAVIKEYSVGFGLWQIFVLRSLLALPVLVIIGTLILGGRALLPRKWSWVILRSAFLTCSWIAYYSSLPHLELSVAAAVFYTIPMFITLFAALFLGDRINQFGWAAVVIGFLGVLIILRPSSTSFNLALLLPLLAAIFYALAMILTRSKCKSEPPLALSLGLNLVFIATGLSAMVWVSFSADDTTGFLNSPWITMGKTEWIAMSVLAAAILIGSIGAAIAYQNGPPSIIGVFDFSYVAFAVLWGLIFFGEVPDVWSVIGISLICGAGILASKYG